MYAMVLCMALSSGPGANPDYPVPDAAGRVHDQRVYRGHGCNGGCCGGGYGCCGGGYGGGWGCHGGGGWGCNGGGWGCNGGGYGCCGGGRPSMYYDPNQPAGPRPMPEMVPPPKQARNAAAPATLVVNLPADGVLTIDDAPTAATTARRTFVSPPLEAGVEYHYNLKMEVNRNGQTVATTRRVTVRAGEQTEVTLEAPAAGVARR